MTCDWKDEKLQLEILPLCSIQVFMMKLSVWMLKKGKFSFIVPLTDTLFDDNWSSGAYQIKSGASVVINVPSQNLSPNVLLIK